MSERGSGMNNVCIIGRLTRDPELRHTPSGVEVCSFAIAVDRAGPLENGEPTAGFFECTAWKKTAELIAQHFHKGKQIAVTGELRFEKWQAQDGGNRTAVKINVNRMTFVGSKGDGDGGGNGYAGAGATAGGGGDWDFPAAADDDIPF